MVRIGKEVLTFKPSKGVEIAIRLVVSISSSCNIVLVIVVMK